MALSTAEEKELAELEELDRLEKEVGHLAPALPLAKPASRTLEAIAKGAAQGLTLGHLPQIMAASQSASLPGMLGMSDEDSNEGAKQAYISNRDNAIADLAQLRKQEPVAFTGGEIAGSLPAMALLPGGATARGLTAGGRILRGAATGAAVGALQNPGDKAGVLDPIQAEERLKNAAIGGALGGAIEPVAMGLGKVADWAGTAIKKGVSFSSGIPEKVLEKYADKTKQIDKIIKESGGDVTEKVRALRERLNQEIQNTKTKYNRALGDSLQKYPTDKVVPATPMVDALESWKQRLDGIYDADKISQIDEIVNNIKTKAGPESLMSVQDLNKTVSYLQNEGQQAYMKNGQIFTKAKETARAAKDAAAIGRKVLQDVAPETAAARGGLAKLHNLESRLNKSLIKEAAPEGSILAAGSGANMRNRAMLSELESLTGVPAVDLAEQLSAAKALGQDSYGPLITTGRAALGAGLGYGAGGTQGMAAGAFLSSPAAIRKALQARALAAPALQQATQLLENNPEAAALILNRLRQMSGEQ